MSLALDAGRFWRRIRQLRELLHMADESIDDISKDFSTYQTDVSNKFSALEAEIANMPQTVPPAVQQKMDDLGSAIRAADTALASTGETAPGGVPAPTDTTPSASTSPATDPTSISPSAQPVSASPTSTLPDVAGDGQQHEDGSVAPASDAVQPAAGAPEVA